MAMENGTRNRSGLGLAMAGMVAGAMVTMVAGCASPPADPAARAEFQQLNDPLEPANRYFFEVNRALDIFFIKPYAEIYRQVVPDFGRERVHNILDNMGEPLVVANDALQGRLNDSGTVTARFLINSVVGLGGLFDVATGLGLPDKTGDFGQTLYSWGMPDGPYLVLPLFGPSNVRDAVGLGVDTAGDPVGWSFSLNGFVIENYAQFGATALDERSQYIDQLDALEKGSIDFYAQMRSMVRQRRAKELAGDKTAAAGGEIPYPNFDTDEKPTSPPAKK